MRKLKKNGKSSTAANRLLDSTSPALDSKEAAGQDDARRFARRKKEISSKNALNDLTATEWIAATKSLWFQKGLGAAHPHAQIEKLHPAPFSFQDVARLIRFFTKQGQVVLDPFAGVASTLKACALCNRKGIGIELNSEWAELGRLRLKSEVSEAGDLAIESQKIIQGDAREEIKSIADDSIDFVITSPPYWRILAKKADHKIRRERLTRGLATKYSDSELDLGNIRSYSEFLSELVKVFDQCHRVLKAGRYLCVIVGDFRHRSKFYAYHADLINCLSGEDRVAAGSRCFDLSGIIILAQNHKRLYPYGYPHAFVTNQHHQYAIVFRKQARKTNNDAAESKRKNSKAVERE